MDGPIKIGLYQGVKGLQVSNEKEILYVRQIGPGEILKIVSMFLSCSVGANLAPSWWTKGCIYCDGNNTDILIPGLFCLDPSANRNNAKYNVCGQ